MNNIKKLQKECSVTLLTAIEMTTVSGGKNVFGHIGDWFSDLGKGLVKADERLLEHGQDCHEICEPQRKTCMTTHSKDYCTPAYVNCINQCTKEKAASDASRLSGRMV